jgi:hypothetical protein
MNRGRPTSSKDLLPSERSLLEAIRGVGFGHIEFLRIHAGEPVLDPWPSVIADVKFGVDRQEIHSTPGSDFELKREVAEFFEYTREVDDGEIRLLVVRHGLPFTMEIEPLGRTVRQSGGGHA